MSWRFGILNIALIAACGALYANLYKLQIKDGAIFAAQVEARNRVNGILDARRGVISFTDKSGILLPAALNKEYPVVYAVPEEIEDAAEAAEFLSSVLSLKAEELTAKLSKAKDIYEPIATRLTEDQAKQIREARLKGIYLDFKEFRFYQYGGLAANLLGYVGPSKADSEIKGRYGLEAYFDKDLRGIAGEIQDNKVIEPVSGKDLTLTIDRIIQSQAEEILNKAIAEREAVGGTIIVEEVATGKILALANAPSYDPNFYSKSPVSNFLNPAVQSIYEPGSVFKVITMAAGIDAGKITPETKFSDTGFLVLNGRTIRNFMSKAYGTVTMTEVIENSINTGAAFAVSKMGYDNFYDYAVKFGFNAKTGITLPGELSGNLKQLKKDGKAINFATAAFGQGIAVTPIELINAISAIANGGVLMKPYILAEAEPEIIRRVIHPKTADQVTDMMIAAVKKAGAIQIPGFQIAGKTGTAQIPDFKYGGYTEEFIHTFAGFAPAKNPKFAILVKIDKPKVGPLAGFTVVPAFQELAQFMVSYLNIVPE